MTSRSSSFSVFFFFNDTATTEIYTLSLHDALPILIEAPASCQYRSEGLSCPVRTSMSAMFWASETSRGVQILRSEEHTSELQSHLNLVCRLLLEKKKK